MLFFGTEQRWPNSAAPNVVTKLQWGNTFLSVFHYTDVIMSAIASQITIVSIIYSAVCSGADQRKHQNSVSQAFVRGIHRWPMNSPHIGPVTPKMLPFDDVIMSRVQSLCNTQLLWMSCCLKYRVPIHYAISKISVIWYQKSSVRMFEVSVEVLVSVCLLYTGRCNNNFERVIYEHVLHLWAVLVNCSPLNATRHLWW